MKTYNNVHVETKGGNMYLVTIGKKCKLVDLDGFTCISDDDYTLLEHKEEETGRTLITDDMFSEKIARECGAWDEFELAAIRYAANYSGVNVDQYIADTLQD